MRVYSRVMKHFSSIGLALAVAVAVGCQNQGSGNAERHEAERRAALRQQGTPDESQQNLMRAQQDVVNRDGNASRNLSGY